MISTKLRFFMMYDIFWPIVFSLILLFSIRILHILRNHRNQTLSNHLRKTSKTLIVLGSGGHTTEMMNIMKHLNKDIFTPRIYIVASSDKKSILNVTETDSLSNSCSIRRIPRSREVHQSFFSSIFTTLHSILYSLPIVIVNRPNVILCNGPGTCIPICLSAFLLKLLFLSDNIIIFVESICRVKTLSLSGKILYYIADKILVQWPELQNKYPKSTYLGDLKL